MIPRPFPPKSTGAPVRPHNALPAGDTAELATRVCTRLETILGESPRPHPNERPSLAGPSRPHDALSADESAECAARLLAKLALIAGPGAAPRPNPPTTSPASTRASSRPTSDDAREDELAREALRNTMKRGNFAQRQEAYADWKARRERDLAERAAEQVEALKQLDGGES
jgi:hypothetical protein